MSPTSKIRWCFAHDSEDFGGVRCDRNRYGNRGPCAVSESVVVPADIWEHVQVILNEFNEHPIPELLEDA